MDIRVANNPTTLDAARAFVRAHLAFHSVGPADIQRVVDFLPSPYTPPTGELWVAYDGDDPLGCAAFQTIAADTAELKRVFVRPEARRRGVARALMVHAIETIRDRGYARVRLGTQPNASTKNSGRSRTNAPDIPSGCQTSCRLRISPGSSVPRQRAMVRE